jgi:hypothetical protein
VKKQARYGFGVLALAKKTEHVKLGEAEERQSGWWEMGEKSWQLRITLTKKIIIFPNQSLTHKLTE